MSHFERLALESADLGYENEAPFANGEETHTVANEIAEVQGLQFEAADEDAAAEQLDDEAGQTEELAEAVEEEVAQERALDPTAAKLLKIAFKNIVGKNYASKTLPATESFTGSRSEAREGTRIALEGIKETLKAFWEAIKKQFQKAYDAVKSWIVKTFSAAKKLKERAEKLQSKANDTVGTIEDKSFSFGQTKQIAVDGKFSEAGALTSGLSKVKDLVKTTITELKKGKVDDAVENIVKKVESSFSGSGNTRAVSASALVDAIKSVAGNIISGSSIPSSVGDTKKYAEQYGDVSEITVNVEVGFPGGRALIHVEPKTIKSEDLEGLTKVLKASRVTLGNDKFTPRDVSEGDVKTLTTSQIDKVCDDVIDIAETIYTFEQQWKNRDNFINKIVKETDQMVKDFDQEDDAKDNQQRYFRNYVQAQVAFLRREINFEANVCSYGLTTGNAFLNYAERSLAQHKAK